MVFHVGFKAFTGLNEGLIR